jgi:hypothetical protein
MTLPFDAEWLETDGLGGFASGTLAGWRTRRYHGLLIPAIEVPSRRAVLVDGFEAWLERDGARIPLTTQQYVPDVTSPAGHERLTAFEHEPWPSWTWTLDGGIEVTQEIVVPHERPAAVVRWMVNARGRRCRLIVRPLLSGRDTHALHYENPALDQNAEVDGERVRWHTYASMPAVLSLANGNYSHQPVWYRNFLLAEERNRGFEHRVDLFSPGELSWEFADGEALWVLMAEGAEGHAAPGRKKAKALATQLRDAEAERRTGRGISISSGAATGRRSSPVIPGSPTGGGTRSLPCADCASPPGDSTMRARSSPSGRASSRRGCYPIASSREAMPPSSTRWTPRSGT